MAFARTEVKELEPMVKAGKKKIRPLSGRCRVVLDGAAYI